MRSPLICRSPVVEEQSRSFFSRCGTDVEVNLMPWFGSKAMVGALRHAPRAVVALTGLLAATILCAQQPVPITLTVVDKSSAAISGASVEEANGPLLGRTDTNGQV